MGNRRSPEGQIDQPLEMDMTTKHDVFNPADSNVARALDQLRIGESDRQLARECLHNGELMAGLICRAGENLRSAAAFVGHSFTHQVSHPGAVGGGTVPRK